MFSTLVCPGQGGAELTYFEPNQLENMKYVIFRIKQS